MTEKLWNLTSIPRESCPNTFSSVLPSLSELIPILELAICHCPSLFSFVYRYKSLFTAAIVPLWALTFFWDLVYYFTQSILKFIFLTKKKFNA